MAKVPNLPWMEMLDFLLRLEQTDGRDSFYETVMDGIPRLVPVDVGVSFETGRSPLFTAPVGCRSRTWTAQTLLRLAESCGAPVAAPHAPDSVSPLPG